MKDSYDFSKSIKNPYLRKPKKQLLLLCLFLAGCVIYPDIRFLNQSGQDLVISSGNLSFGLNSGETSKAINLAKFFQNPLQITSTQCEALYSADVPNPQEYLASATGAKRDWLFNYRGYSQKLIISSTFELQLEITHKKSSSVHIIHAFGFPAKPEKLACASDN